LNVNHYKIIHIVIYNMLACYIDREVTLINLKSKTTKSIE